MMTLIPSPTVTLSPDLTRHWPSTWPSLWPSFSVELPLRSALTLPLTFPPWSLTWTDSQLVPAFNWTRIITLSWKPFSWSWSSPWRRLYSHTNPETGFDLILRFRLTFTTSLKLTLTGTISELYSDHLPLWVWLELNPFSDSHADSDPDPLPELHPYSHHFDNLDPKYTEFLLHQPDPHCDPNAHVYLVYLKVPLTLTSPWLCLTSLNPQYYSWVILTLFIILNLISTLTLTLVLLSPWSWPSLFCQLFNPQHDPNPDHTLTFTSHWQWAWLESQPDQIFILSLEWRRTITLSFIITSTLTLKFIHMFTLTYQDP